MRRIFLFLFFALFFLPVVSHSLMLRDADEMDFGVVGGYGFPQLGFWNSQNVASHMNKSSDEYSFGILFNAFLLDDFSLSTELTYTYNKISLKRKSGQSSSWKDYFIDINMVAQKYWFEFLYFGAGLYLRAPFHNFVTNAPNMVGSTGLTMGALLEVGVDMKIFEHFALKIAGRFHLPFMSYLSLSKNHYTLWTFPANFVFALEWVI